MRIFILLLLPLNLFLKVAIGQTWEKNYGLSGRFDVFQNLTESYDNGFLVLGATDYFPDTRGWVIKTDINGNILYQIRLGIENIANEINLPFFIENTKDGGSIICTAQGSSYFGDIGIIKLDACGDLEWCKVFRTDGQPDWGVEIQQLNDGGFVMLTQGYQATTNNPKIHLFRLNHLGEVLWIEPYATTTNNPYVGYNQPYDLVTTPDEDFFISGLCYWCEDTAGTGGVNNECRLKAMAILADSNKQEQWVSAFQYEDTLAYSMAGWSTQKGSGN
ncbi:MAG: hypothetical protein RBS07_08180, partial [Lentimicrobium sp.]|nr:hypothetical protein [Lentimicrobium sp.]